MENTTANPVTIDAADIRAIDAFVDGQLSDSERRDLLTRLMDQPELKRYLLQQKHYKQTMNSRAPRRTAPAALRAAIQRIPSGEAPLAAPDRQMY